MKRMLIGSLAAAYYVLGLITFAFSGWILKLIFLPVTIYVFLAQAITTGVCGTDFPFNLSCAIIGTFIWMAGGLLLFVIGAVLWLGDQ